MKKTLFLPSENFLYAWEKASKQANKQAISAWTREGEVKRSESGASGSG